MRRAIRQSQCKRSAPEGHHGARSAPQRGQQDTRRAFGRPGCRCEALRHSPTRVRLDGQRRRSAGVVSGRSGRPGRVGLRPIRVGGAADVVLPVLPGDGRRRRRPRKRVELRRRAVEPDPLSTHRVRGRRPTSRDDGSHVRLLGRGRPTARAGGRPRRGDQGDAACDPRPCTPNRHARLPGTDSFPLVRRAGSGRVVVLQAGAGAPSRVPSLRARDRAGPGQERKGSTRSTCTRAAWCSAKSSSTSPPSRLPS